MLDLGTNNYNDSMAEAAGGGHLEIVQMMLNKGGERLTIDDYNLTMDRAAEGGYRKIVQKMI